MQTNLRIRLAFVLSVLGSAVALSATAAAAPTFGNAFTNALNGCAPVTATWLTGMEHGVASTSGGGIFSAVQNPTAVTVDYPTARNGFYALKLAPAGVSTYASRTLSASSTVVARFALRLAALPAANAQLASVGTTTGQTLILSYDAATQKLTLSFTGGGLVASVDPVEAAAWYVLDLRLSTGSNPLTADWQVNGTAQPSTSVTAGPGSVAAIRWGTLVPGSYTMSVDDLMLSQTSADYPIGNGRVLTLGPHTNAYPASNFREYDNTTIDSQTWQRVDDSPLNSTYDFVKQTTASASSSVQFNFYDTTSPCVRAVGALLAYSNTSTSSNNGKTSIFDGATERVVYSGPMNATALTYKSAAIAPAGSAWTPSALNGLVARIGYSTDVSPAPQWHAVRLEYELLPDTVAPTVSDGTICMSIGGCATSPGYIKQGGGYDVWALASDSGGPPEAGVKSGTADLSAISAGVTAGTLSWGYEGSLGGGSFVASNPLAEGTYTYTITGIDWAGNMATYGPFEVVVDNTPPYVVDVQTVNKPGGVAGKAEQGDKVVVTWSEPVATYGIWPNHTDSTNQYCAKITNSGANDILTVFDQHCATIPASVQYRQFGSTALGGDYVSADTRWGGSSPNGGTIRRDDNTWTVTLGVASGANANTVGGNTTMTATGIGSGWCRDSATNFCTTGSATESGAADLDF